VHCGLTQLDSADEGLNSPGSPPDITPYRSKPKDYVDQRFCIVGEYTIAQINSASYPQRDVK